MTKCLLCGTDRNRLAGKLTDLRAELEAERQRTAEAREVANTLLTYVPNTGAWLTDVVGPLDWLDIPDC